MSNETQTSVDVTIEQLWRKLDVKREGEIDFNGLKRGLQKIDHPLKNADVLLRDSMKAMGMNGDGKIQFKDFQMFLKETERALWSLFNSIDRDQNGKLDKEELRLAFARAGLAVPNSKLDQFFAEVDTNRDGVISFDEWRNFLLLIPVNAPSLKAVLSYYSAAVTLNPEGDVQVGGETIQSLGNREPAFPTSFIQAIFSIASPRRKNPHRTTTPQRSAVQSLQNGPPKQHQTPVEVVEVIPPVPWPLPAVPADATSSHSITTTGSIPSDEVPATFTKSILTNFPDPGYFLAGGMAGVVSRTVTAPLDRLKVYLISQTGVAQEAVQAVKQGDAIQAATKASRPLVEASKALWRAGGMRSLFSGNGLNVIKIMPESAIKFGSFEGSKRLLKRLQGLDESQQLGGASKFLAGGIAGLISQFCVYPVDTLKFRMQCETVKGGLHGNRLLVTTAKKMWATHGIRAYYRGLTMGLVGMFPYAAIDLGTFEYLKRAITIRNARLLRCHEEDAPPSSIATAAIGAFSGAIGASAVYPLNLLRTRLQAQGTAIHPPTYTGIVDVTRKTVNREGFRGLFKGLTPNLLKVMPAVSISYVVYENSKRLLGLR